MASALTGLSGFEPPIGIIAGPGVGAGGVGGSTVVDPSDLPGAGAVQAVGNAITAVPDFLNFLVNQGGALRVAEAFAGGVLILGGLFLLGAKTETGQTVIKTAGTAAKGAAL